MAYKVLCYLSRLTLLSTYLLSSYPSQGRPPPPPRPIFTCLQLSGVDLEMPPFRKSRVCTMRSTRHIYSGHDLPERRCCKYFDGISLPPGGHLHEGKTETVLSLSPARLAEDLACCEYVVNN